jgi:DNA processing protein
MLETVSGIAGKNARAIRDFRDWKSVDNELVFIEKFKVRALPYTHDQYPQRLNHIPDGPLVIFVMGQTDLNHKRYVSVIGTRNSTNYGRDICSRIVQELKEHNVHVVSGLAYGIDIAAHRACNEAGIINLAVVGHGLNQVYPSEHTNDVKKTIAQGGAMISELPSDTKMVPDLFPRRNRLVAALCDAILVVESKIKGGSMITANLAKGYERDVFAVPGRVTDPASQGCNRLIRNNEARICTGAGDIAYLMNWELKKKEIVQKKLFPEMNAEEKKVTEILGQGELHYDRLLMQCELPMSKLTYTLFELEMKNVVRVLPGNVYELVN